MSERIITAGPTGGAPNRLEIHEFVQNDKFFSLYVQALQTMYDADQDKDELSYFRIAGIHGLPYEPWNGAGQKLVDSPGDTEQRRYGGYCTHGSTLFPTWHRPYMALLEQTIQKHAKELAETYQVDKDQWVQAAENLRQPYWDFARFSLPPPEVISLTSVPITTADGTKKSISNPLHHYTFHPTPDYFWSPINRLSRTFRRPRGTVQDPSDNVEELTQVLESHFNTRKRNIYNMLTIVDTWDGFASHTPSPGVSIANSLESLHDNVHGDIGGAGHMSFIPVAAFDPIFWLHHANVDRLLSLWSALHPGVWVTPGEAALGSLTLDVDERVDENTALTPFWNSETNFWTSAGLHDTARQGYSYPEFNGLDLNNPQAVQSAIATIVNQLYDPRAARIASVVNSGRVAGGVAAVAGAAITAGAVAGLKPNMTKEVVVDNQKVQVPVSAPSDSFTAAGALGAGQGPTPTNEALDTNFWEWTAHLTFKHFELGSSFYVLFFLGTVPEDQNTWETAPNTIGSKFAFVNNSAAHCANCVARLEGLEEGCVPLDDGIIKHSGLTHLTPGDVIPYLAENLNWRVIMISNETYEMKEVQLPSLEVTVRAYPLTFQEGAYFPTAGETVSYPDITKGKVGGARA